MLFEEILLALDPEPHSAALNMALDEALLHRAQRPTLRVYRWRTPAVSFGYFGKLAEAEAAAGGRELVRRWTGGGIVEHGADLTYTLMVPMGAMFLRHAPLESYRMIHEQIAQWLTARGIAAAVAPGSAGANANACFAAHVRYDVVNGTGKIAGAAQRRTRCGLLHQGSIQTPLKDTAGLAESLAEHVQPMEIAGEVVSAAEQIAEQKYATAAWLRKS